MAGATIFLQLTRVGLVAIIALCCCAWLLYLIVKPQVWLSTGHKWNAATNGTAIYYHYLRLNLPQLKKVTASVRKQDSIVLEYNFLQEVILNFGSIMIAAICCYLLWVVRDKQPKRRDQRSLLSKLRTLAKRVLFFDLPPRRFFTWWCGGLSVLDLLVVLSVLALSLCWSYFVVNPKYIRIRGQIAAGTVKPRAGHLNMLHQTSSSIGTATQIPMLLFFLPVTKNSFLHYMFNTDFAAIVKYHKWIGWILCWMIMIHGAIYYTYWSLNATPTITFRKYFFKWGNDHSNNLAGNIAGLFTLIIMVSSWSYIRRNFFQVFIRLHAIGYIGFIIFSFIHFWARWYHVTPSLVLLGLDWTFRLVQWLHPSFVTGQFVTADKSIITLQLKWKKAALPRPGQSMWLNIPSGRRSQWHPVSIADVNYSEDKSAIVTAHMKAYGNWTTQMIAEMVERGKLVMRAEGPYGQPYGPRLHRFNVLVIIAGGIGATPMLGKLRDIVQQQKQGLRKQGPGSEILSAFPDKIYMHWSCRGCAEFALLDQDLLDAHREEGGWLDINLYTTRKTNQQGVHTDFSYEDGLNKLGENQPLSVNLPSKWVPLGDKFPSVFGFKPAPLEGQGGIWIRITATFLGFLGTFFACLMAMAYDKTHAIETGLSKAWWKTAVMVVIGIFVGTMGFSSLLLFPHAFYRRRKHSLTKNEMSTVKQSDFEVNKEFERPEIMTHESLVGTEEAPAILQIQQGRPNIPEILAQIRAQHADQNSVAIFTAGPETMAQAVRLEAAKLNDTWNKPYFELSNYAFQL